MNKRTALWFWDVGGMKVDFMPNHEMLSRRPRMGADKITCYTCGATFAWPTGMQPQCPMCKSRGSCHSGPVLSSPGVFDIHGGAGNPQKGCF
jgi:hypothetical protein